MIALTAHPDPTLHGPTPSAPAEPFPRAHLLDLLLNPTKSLQDVAAGLNTTLDQLSLFLASDQGEALLSQAHHLRYETVCDPRLNHQQKIGRASCRERV